MNLQRIIIYYEKRRGEEEMKEVCCLFCLHIGMLAKRQEGDVWYE